MDKDLARAFRLAQKEIREGRAWFICVALERLYQKGQLAGWEFERARAIIQERMEGHAYLEDWLLARCPEYRAWYSSTSYQSGAMTDYRCRWLDSLIEEFS